jgi:hypothetical protein
MFLNLFSDAVSTADVMNSAEVNYLDVCPFSHVSFRHFLASFYNLPPPLPATMI